MNKIVNRNDMSELAFHNNDKLNLNPYGDPLGHDAHQGLERFM